MLSRNVQDTGNIVKTGSLGSSPPAGEGAILKDSIGPNNPPQSFGRKKTLSNP